MGGYFILLFCLAITLHNLEEAILLPNWSQQDTKFQKSVTPTEFRFAVSVITIAAYSAASPSTIYFQGGALPNGFLPGF